MCVFLCVCVAIYTLQLRVCYMLCPYIVATPRLLSANQMVAAASFPTYALQSPILKTGNVVQLFLLIVCDCVCV